MKATFKKIVKAIVEYFTTPRYTFTGYYITPWDRLWMPLYIVFMIGIVSWFVVQVFKLLIGIVE